MFFLLIAMMTGMIYRLYYIDAADSIAAAAEVQGKYRLTVARTRGVIYDREMKPLVNGGYRYVAAVLPTPESAAALVRVTEEAERGALLARLSGGLPFALTVRERNLYADGIDLFRVPERYAGERYAPHLVGYLADGSGAAGLERAYEGTLTKTGGEIGVLYRMDAAGRMLRDAAAAVERTNEEPRGGIVLSLDRDMQAAVQTVLAAGCEKGAAVVLDILNGDILAMASLPAFDQSDVAASLDSEDAPFVNRAVSGYAIGSVFKLLVASGALESGISRAHEYYCAGYIDAGGQIFRCNNNAVHGVCDMERALEVSCNCYFIALAGELRPDALLSLAGNMGLGEAVRLAEGMNTQPGNLPAAAELESPAAYANFSFGQGSSLCSPLQMAGAVAAIANGGLAFTPRLVKGTTGDGLTLSEALPGYAGKRVLSEQTSAVMRELMVAVVEEGSGRPAMPFLGSAGGKTSSAQTGQLVDGKEVVHAWFAGFYPADRPRYAIAVLAEGGESGERAAAPIFKGICDTI